MPANKPQRHYKMARVYVDKWLVADVLRKTNAKRVWTGKFMVEIDIKRSEWRRYDWKSTTSEPPF